MPGMKQHLEERLQSESAKALKTEGLQYLYADYFVRSEHRFPGEKENPFKLPLKVFQTKHGSIIQRKDPVRDVEGATDMINWLTANSSVSGAAHRESIGRVNNDFYDAQAKILMRDIEKRLVDTSGIITDRAQMVEKVRKELAPWLANVDPRHFDQKIGKFTMNPVEAFHLRMSVGMQAERFVDIYRHMLKQPGTVIPRLRESKVYSSWPKLKELDTDTLGIIHDKSIGLLNETKISKRLG